MSKTIETAVSAGIVGMGIVAIVVIVGIVAALILISSVAGHLREQRRPPDGV